MVFTLTMLIAAYLPDDREFTDRTHRWFTSCIDDLYDGYFDPYRTGRKRPTEDGHYLKSQFRVKPDLYDTRKSSVVWLPYSRTWPERLRPAVENRPALGRNEDRSDVHSRRTPGSLGRLRR